MSPELVTMDLLAWTFGDRVRKIRRVLGVSQEEFASVLQQGRQALATWESGANQPRNAIAIAKRIEVAYGVPAAWTLGLETQNAPGPGGPGVDLRARRDSNPQPSDP